MEGKSLGDAARLFRARKFPEVIRVLEPQVFRFRESFDYFLLLGLSCLHTGDVGGAQSYLGRARQLNGDDVRPLLGLAAIHFKKAEAEQALKVWLEVLEGDPGNRIARRGMGILRKGFSPERLQEYASSGRMRSLLPPLPPRARAGLVIGILLAVCAVAAGAFIGYTWLTAGRSDRPGVSAVEIPADLPRLIDAGTQASYVLTERQVTQGFQRAKKLLLAYRDNLAVLEINRILLSNAALPVKERARLLKGFVARPTFTTFRDGFPYGSVLREPELYDGASVLWRGKVANLAAGKDEVRFDLLVGYEQERELQGIVPVVLRFAADLQNGVPLEVLAQVTAVGGILRLEGIALHRIALP
jgi:hypothetical protein